MSGFISGKNDSAVDELLSQVNDEYDLEQVAAINCASFTDDSARPTNLETRLRRLKSLPVARTYPVSSSSKKLLSHSKSMASYNTGKKSLGNVSSASANFSIQTGKSCPLDSSVEETQIFSEIKRNPSVNSRGKLGDFSDSGRSSGSSSSRFSQEGNVFAPTTQTMKLLVPKEESRISSSSSTSINLASPSASDQDQKERMKRKSKSKFLTSWFDKLSLTKAMGCLPSKSSSSNSKKTKEIIKEESSSYEDFETFKKRAEEEEKQRNIMVDKVLKKVRRVRSNYMRN